MKPTSPYDMPAALLLVFAGLAVPGIATAACSVSATGVSFGNYDPLSGSDVESTGEVEVTCSNLLGVNITYEIALDTGVSGTYSPREMDSSGNRLEYQLYTDSSRTIVWGDGSGGTETVTDGYLLQVTSRTETYPIYGAIPASQLVAAGSYADTITVTLTY